MAVSCDIPLVGTAGAARVNIAQRPPLDWDGLYAWAEKVIPAFKK